MKVLRIFSAIALLLTIIPFSQTSVAVATPSMSLDRTAYDPSQTITVTFSGTDAKDWIGLYPYGYVPGGMNSVVWQYAEGNGTLTFRASDLGGAGDYRAFLCDNDGYDVLDTIAFTVRDGDATDYGVKSASVKASVTRGKSKIAVTVTPSSAAELTYRFYWAKNGVRLNEYLYIKEMKHSGAETFTAQFNDCLFMPAEADSIEVAVVNGTSSSYFAAAPAMLKVPLSKKLYEFQVFTDIHLSPDLKPHVPNYKTALRDAAMLSPNSIGVFHVGDNTDRGTQAHYDLLHQTVAQANVDLPLYYAIGNHDLVYGGTYEEEVNRFISNFNTPGTYYSMDLSGARFIMMASEVQTTQGALSSAQMDWLETQLAGANPDAPVFLFLHQSLKDTVSGSLTSLGQKWYGVPDATVRMRSILKKYPNVIYFSGHTHWSLEMTQPFLYGDGVDASFMNAASVAYLYSDDDKDLPGSEGLFVEVYEDYILIKGREFTQSQWCGAAQFLIPRHPDATAQSLISDNATEWVYDSSVMRVESDGYATAFSNTNGQWPYADYSYAQSITVDPSNTLLYTDIMMDADARANIYLFAGNSTVSLSPYMPSLSYDAASGDLIGNGKRARGVIDLSKVAFDASCYNEDGTITFKATRIYASGEAGANMRIYDFSIASDRSAKTVSLMNAQALVADTPMLSGNSTYANGVLTVNSAASGEYSVSFELNETYDVSTLKHWLVKVNATVPFDISITATTAGEDATFSLTGDFWPLLCQAKDNGYIPCGQYETALDLYSCYTFNGLEPADGMSTLKRVTITLGGAGTLRLDALQMSSVQDITVSDDGMYRTITTPLFKRGDVNGDDTVSTVDARLVLGHVLGVTDNFTDVQKAAADYDENGSLSTTDVRQMLQELING